MLHTYIPPARFLPYLTWQEIQAMPNKATVVIVQPVGAIEQHGPHLPLIVDAAIGTAVIGQALAQLDASIPVYCLPTLYYGKSNEHWHFPGTITLSAQTLMAVLTEVGESIYRAGFRKLVWLNAHGGQPQVIEMVARDLHQRYADFVLFPHFVWQAPHQAGQFLTDLEKAYGIHAGDAETSVMLSLLPEQVHMDKAVKEYPPDLSPDGLISLEGKLPVAWTTQDISQSGVVGDATQATREKGDQIVESLVQGWVQVLAEIYRFQLPQANPPHPPQG
jgi:creatinine amidohydrolase